jgi:hypothetical protein
VEACRGVFSKRLQHNRQLFKYNTSAHTFLGIFRLIAIDCIFVTLKLSGNDADRIHMRPAPARGKWQGKAECEGAATTRITDENCRR